MDPNEHILLNIYGQCSFVCSFYTKTSQNSSKHNPVTANCFPFWFSNLNNCTLYAMFLIQFHILLKSLKKGSCSLSSFKKTKCQWKKNVVGHEPAKRLPILYEKCWPYEFQNFKIISVEKSSYNSFSQLI